ncbi:MAG: hypothetical protein JJ971_10010 [Balneolaceae bacterium]|nr:hypothetical protein [Balneolaceae bacterium]MBO6546419.1 hypothetical protein [Balneolaceae bacterium]MBO6648778.1 hypothetical protein [Balneolaceae bacterium]
MTSAQKAYIELYRSIIDHVEGIELKGKTMPYTSVNGRMFSQLNKDGEIGIRLSEVEMQKFFSKFPDSKPFKSYGATLKGYVLIPEEMLADPALIGEYLAMSYQHVLTLEPK